MLDVGLVVLAGFVVFVALTGRRGWALAVTAIDDYRKTVRLKIEDSIARKERSQQYLLNMRREAKRLDSILEELQVNGKAQIRQAQIEAKKDLQQALRNIELSREQQEARLEIDAADRLRTLFFRQVMAEFVTEVASLDKAGQQEVLQRMLQQMR